jgi:hypothetical protein
MYNPLAENIQDKWRYNGPNDLIGGYNQLPLYGDFLILTKSMKDVMVLYEMQIPAVTLQSESALMNTLMFESLRKRFNNIIVLYDNDSPGIKFSDKISKSFGLKQIFLPKFGPEKDISDYVREHSFNDGVKMMNSLLMKYGYRT